MHAIRRRLFIALAVSAQLSMTLCGAAMAEETKYLQGGVARKAISTDVNAADADIVGGRDTISGVVIANNAQAPRVISHATDVCFAGSVYEPSDISGGDVMSALIFGLQMTDAIMGSCGGGGGGYYSGGGGSS